MQAQPDPSYPPPPSPIETPFFGVRPRPVPVEPAPGSLLAVARRIGRLWWLILLVSLGASALAYGWMTTTRPLYTAHTVVTATDSSANRFGGALSTLSFGASQLGIDLGAAPTEPTFTEFLQLMSSLTLAERLESKYGVLRTLYAGRWDEARGRWLPPKGMIPRLEAFLRAAVGQKAWSEPSIASLAGFLANEVAVNDATGNGMYLIELSFPDPAFARELLVRALKEADDIVKERTIARSREQIAYLKEKLAETSLRDQRNTLLAFLMLEERNVLLASSDLPFAAKFVDEVSVSDLPTFPDPFRILLMALVGGAFLTVLGILVVDVVRYA